MESTYKHYVPVLRAKQAEWRALEALSPSVRSAITPLVELTPDVATAKPKAAAKVGRTSYDHALHLTLANLSPQLAHGRAFLDFGHLAGRRAAAWTLARQIGNGPVTGLVPVTTLPNRDGRLADFRAMTGGGVGVCLRVPATMVRQTTFAAALAQELQDCGLNRGDADLVVDLGCDPRSLSHDDLRAVIPALDEWRSWTVLAGVFPLNLVELDANQLEYRLPRDEWLAWRAQVTRSLSSVRRPAFGDFTIQYGEYIPAPKVAGSLSVRYTLATEYLVLRGRKPNAAIGVGFDQYHGHARYLTSKSDYYGANFSSGDSFINQKCVTGAGTGDRLQWLAAGINHHITATVAQLADPAL